MITRLDLNPDISTYDSARIPLDRPMIRISTRVISSSYDCIRPLILCLIEQVFTIVHKLLIFNDLQILAQMP